MNPRLKILMSNIKILKLAINIAVGIFFLQRNISGRFSVIDLRLIFQFGFLFSVSETKMKISEFILLV